MDIINLIKHRRTIRKFDQKPVDTNQLMSYIDSARLAPSGSNLQPLKYYVAKSEDIVNKVFSLLRWAGYLPDYAPKKDERPVAYIVVCIDRKIRATGAEFDVGAAVENIILAALSEGVGSCWLASVDRAELTQLMDIPSNHEIASVVALGYPKEKPRDVMSLGDIKYYLDGETLCVPKRPLTDVIVKIM